MIHHTRVNKEHVTQQAAAEIRNLAAQARNHAAHVEHSAQVSLEIETAKVIRQAQTHVQVVEQNANAAVCQAQASAHAAVIVAKA